MDCRQLSVVQDKKTGKLIVQRPLQRFICLALEGGGVRGSAYAGAFNILSHYGMLDDIEHVAGSSAGSIAALGLALGYDAQQMQAALNSLPLDRFIEEDASSRTNKSTLFSQAKKILPLLTQGKKAVSSGMIMRQWVESHVAAALGNKDATFRDLQNAIGKQQSGQATTTFKNLYVCSTNIGITIPEETIFSFATTPDMPIALAVCASSALPTVFEPIKWHGGVYVDGGCKNNLPAKIFDTHAFLAPGQTFTERGVNPGTLSIKIDTPDEILQVMHGVKQPVAIDNAKDVISQVAYAFTDNVDATEFRESRIVIPLTDNNISWMNFTIDNQGKISLSTSAEHTTQDFLENHVSAAYDVKVYTTLKDWLDTLSMDQLDDVICIYQAMQNDRNKNDVNIYIDYLESYYQFRRAAKRYPNAKFEMIAPTIHVDINKKPKQVAWVKKVKASMLDRIKIMEKHLAIINKKIAGQCALLGNDHHDMLVHKLHCDIFESIKVLTGYQEYKRVLEDEKNDLEMKLGLRQSCDPKSAHTPNLHKLYTCIAELNKTPKCPAPLKVVLDCINLYRPIIAHRSTHETDNILFTYDLMQKDECKQFLIAAILYLRYRKCSEVGKLSNLYANMFAPGKYPENIDELSVELQHRGASLLVSAYRIQELMQYFERLEQPNKIPTANIDKAFGVTEHLIFPLLARPASPSQDGMRMTNFFRTAPPRKSERDLGVTTETSSSTSTCLNAAD